LLPRPLLPSAAEAAALERYAARADELLAMTPDRRGEYEALTLAAVTGLLLAKPAPASNELAAGAKEDSYMDALDDVAFWAVEAAIRRWHRGECGTVRGEERDYRWAPDTVTLRNLARAEEHELRRRADGMRLVAAALPAPAELTDEHRGRMAAAWRGLLACFKDGTLRRETTVDELARIGHAGGAEVGR
jgi:hypothetical protein